MIEIAFNKPLFEYDIHGVITAFYAKEKLVFHCNETCSEIDENGVCIFYGEKGVRVSYKGITKEEAYPSLEHRRDVKTAVKNALYRLLAQLENRTLPWGTLIGIRPTKMGMELLRNGYSYEQIEREMIEHYFVSEEKAKLCTDIVFREHALLSQHDYNEGYSIYIGIPFCPTTCLYCSFTSYPIGAYKMRMDDYLACLKKELAFTAEHFKNSTLHTIYIGGGTPTTLEANQLEVLMQMIHEYFDVKRLKEFTVEAGRPDSITKEKLEVLKRYHCDRISINPQTMNQKTLDTIGRRHLVEQIVECVRLAREVGFDNINMDIILGLPNETIEDLAVTLQKIKALAPDNLTVHSLSLKRTSRLNLEKEKYDHFTWESTEKMMEAALEAAEDMQVAPYYLYRQKNIAGNLENIGFAKAGKEGIYNILMMEEIHHIVAIGAGAASKAVFANNRIDRCENVKELEQYISRIDEMIERKKKLFVEE